MLVKDIIANTARLVGRADAADAIAADSGDGEIVQLTKTMLFCFNAVVDELARAYFPLKRSEYLVAPTGQYKFSDFGNTPTKILSVSWDGQEVEWHILPGYLQTESRKINVEYEYVPDKAELTTDFYFPEVNISDRLISYGMAAEYMLIQGEIGSAECWEKRYREEIDRAMVAQPVNVRIPPRRWV